MILCYDYYDDKVDDNGCVFALNGRRQSPFNHPPPTPGTVVCIGNNCVRGLRMKTVARSVVLFVVRKGHNGLKTVIT